MRKSETGNETEIRVNNEAQIEILSLGAGIAIDDSKMQRKVLAKILAFTGIADERISVVGSTADDIRDFEAMVARHVREHPDDHHLVIVDEILDIQQECGGHLVVSGSQTIAALRRTLSAEDLEGKLLAIVRSASDSAVDVAVFRDRAHGFIEKSSLRRDKILETLAPIWLARFPRAPT